MDDRPVLHRPQVCTIESGSFYYTGALRVSPSNGPQLGRGGGTELNRGRRAGGWSLAPAGLLLGGSLGALFQMTLRDTARVSGHDLGVFGVAFATLLIAGLAGGLVGFFLIRRHHGLAGHLFACCGLLAALYLAAVPPDRTALLEFSARIHGPDVTRTHFLAGVALTAALLSAVGAALLSGAGAALLSRAGWIRVAAPLLLGLLVGSVATVSEPLLLAALLAALSVVAGHSLHAFRLVGLALLATILLTAERREGAWNSPWKLDDPIRLATGAAIASDLSGCIQGRDWRPPEIPGWPFEGPPLQSVLALVRRLSGPGPLLLLGAEGPPLAAQANTAGDLRHASRGLGPDELPAGVLLLPSLFAHPWPALRSALNTLGRFQGQSHRPLAICVDLSELTYQDVAIAAALLDSGPAEPVTLLHGTHCLFLSFGGLDRQQRMFREARTLGLLPFLSVNATRGLIQYKGDTRAFDLLLCRSRTRRASRSFRQAAVNLHRLGRRADGPGFLSKEPPPGRHSDLLAVELAVAILQDDTFTEDHLLFLLEQIEPVRARRLRSERLEAREHLLSSLRAGLRDSPHDVDIHHRLGRILSRNGQVLEGIDRLTRAIRLRPKQFDAAVDLGRAYLQAEQQGLRRPTPTGAIDGCRFLFYGLPRYLRGLEDPYDRARLKEARGRASLCLALREPDPSEARTEWLEKAQGEFRRATRLDPLNDGAHRGLARILVLLDRRDEARESVILSIRRNPFEPEGYHLLADLSLDPEEARLARETAGRLTGR